MWVQIPTRFANTPVIKVSGMEEMWKPIKIEKNGTRYDFSGKYEVSSFGNIRNVRTGYTLKPKIGRRGYFVIQLRLDGIRKMHTFYVHRLVATVFLPHCDELPQVNHIDGNKLNNNVMNLEWCTGAYNSKHAYNAHLRNHVELENSRKKATAAVSVKVNQYTQGGEFVKTYSSYLQAARAVGVTLNAIKKCCKGKQKTSAGYIWKCA